MLLSLAQTTILMVGMVGITLTKTPYLWWNQTVQSYLHSGVYTEKILKFWDTVTEIFTLGHPVISFAVQSRINLEGESFVDNPKFKVGDVVKFGPNYHPYGSDSGPLFAVEPSDPEMLTCRCISTGDNKAFKYVLGSLYFAPPSFFVRCSTKDKFRGRTSCE